ncbi:MAG TPA: hypothetical protein VJC18_04425 [bacterium]|nr:hypothetical protein [bacterium]
MKRVKWILIFLFSCLACLGGGTVWAATSCENTTTTCEDMCAHVYDTCAVSLIDSGGSARSEAECVSACASTDPAVISCLASVSCTAEAVDNCLISATSTGTSTDDSSYIGGGGVSDGETTTSGGACGEITDCNSCISNCRCRYDGTVAASQCCTGCGCECELYCMPTEWWIATCI